MRSQLSFFIVVTMSDVSLLWFEDFLLYLTFIGLMVMNSDVVFFIYILLKLHWTSLFHGCLFLNQFWKIFNKYLLFKCFVFHALSLIFFEDSNSTYVQLFMLSHRFLTLFLFSFFVFSSSFASIWIFSLAVSLSSLILYFVTFSLLLSPFSDFFILDAF